MRTRTIPILHSLSHEGVVFIVYCLERSAKNNGYSSQYHLFQLHLELIKNYFSMQRVFFTLSQKMSVIKGFDWILRETMTWKLESKIIVVLVFSVTI